MGLMTPNKTKPQNGGDATGFQDLGGGVRETENVRERREEPQVLGFREDMVADFKREWVLGTEKRKWWV